MASRTWRSTQAWAGRRWSVRRKTFAHVLTVEGPGEPTTVLTFRSSGAELGVLHSRRAPVLPARMGHQHRGDGAGHDTDWDEVAELMTESYCVQAPKKLVALVERPAEP